MTLYRLSQGSRRVVEGSGRPIGIGRGFVGSRGIRVGSWGSRGIEGCYGASREIGGGSEGSREIGGGSGRLCVYVVCCLPLPSPSSSYLLDTFVVLLRVVLRLGSWEGGREGKKKGVRVGGRMMVQRIHIDKEDVSE